MTSTLSYRIRKTLNAVQREGIEVNAAWYRVQSAFRGKILIIV